MINDNLSYECKVLQGYQTFVTHIIAVLAEHPSPKVSVGRCAETLVWDTKHRNNSFLWSTGPSLHSVWNGMYKALARLTSEVN